MGKAPAFQIYPMDFDMDTATWENDQVGAYLRLLFYEWINGGLPDDTYKLAKIVRENERKFKKKWLIISQKFIQNGNGLLINRKLEEVRQQQAQYVESQREKGKHGANKRWGQPIAGAIATAMPVLQPNDSSSSSSLSSNNKERIIRKKIPDEEWLKELQLKECYGHLNIKDQLQKCITWFEAKGITVSRQRFLNWINNPKYQSKPLSTYSITKKEIPNPEIIPKDFKPDPHGQERIKELIASISKGKGA